ncbi:MAG: hypothetical protein KF693_00270 [Nitrospira sp.]|nr:hypothetical protein [Nitrospira sp.]
MAKPKPKDVNQKSADQVIRQYYEGEDSQQEGAFPEDTLAPVSTTDPALPDATLHGGDIDAAQHQTDAGENTVGGSSPTPDQDVVEELGEAVGITYEDNEPLRVGDKLGDRDAQRWELNPASSEDYHERLRELSGGGKSSAEQAQPAERSTRARKAGKRTSRAGRRTAPRARKAPKKRR